jgi:hypothetical protein
MPAKKSTKGGGNKANSDTSSEKPKVNYCVHCSRSLAWSLIRRDIQAGLKAATAVNVRHILCEKHSKATEALQKIQVGIIVPLLVIVCLNHGHYLLFWI